MPKEKDTLDVRGEITETLPGGKFRVTLETGHEVIAHMSGQIRKNRIRLTVGDEIKVEMTPYDLTKGRITYRF